MINFPKDRIPAFYARIQRAPSGCWLWLGARTPEGYGTVIVHGKAQRVHRVMYSLKHKEPYDQYVRHTCDNTLCVNPDHLVAGTHQDNMLDIIRYERNKKYLTIAQVQLVRRLAKQGYTYTHIGKLVNRSAAAISRCVNKITYHVV